MTHVEIKTETLSFEKAEEKDGKFYFTAESLNTEFECEEGLRRLAKDNINKHLIWRHEHPIQKENSERHVLGVITKSFVENGKLFSKYHAYDHTQTHKDFIELVKERINVGDPLGISMRYRKYFDKPNGNIIHYDVFEHSGTPFPKCEICKTIDYIGENEMPDKDEKEKEDKKIEETEDKTNEDESDVAVSLKKIEELQNSLDSKTESFEKLQERIVTLEAELEDKDKVEKEKMTMEDRINELEKEVDYFKKKPVLDEMFEIKDLDEDEKEFYKNKDDSYLEKKLEEWKSETETKIQVKSQEASADEVLEDVDKKTKKDVKNEKKVDMKQFTSMLPANVREKFVEQKGD